jgi:DNA adenine methylase
MTITAKPFLKWAGGKGQLIDDIDSRLPEGLLSEQIDTYVEPFIGGGAVFFHMAVNFPWLKRFVLIDVNEDLVNCYAAIREQVSDVVAELKQLEKKYFDSEEDERQGLFLQVRENFNADKGHVSREKTTARLIFLNKTCFNGLYRVNSKGKFNVPFGKYTNPKICDERNLKAASKVLQQADIIYGDFTLAREYIGENTFFYFDPPYRPISKTASFTSYAKDSFSEEDQIKLAEFCREVDRGGGKFLLSNSDPKNEDPKDHFFEGHYKGFTIDRVKASRAINCKAEGRGLINELLITNY